MSPTMVTVGDLTQRDLGRTVEVATPRGLVVGVLHGVRQHRSPIWHTHVVIDGSEFVAPSPKAPILLTSPSAPPKHVRASRCGAWISIVVALSGIAAGLVIALTTPPLSGGTIAALLLVATFGALAVRVIHLLDPGDGGTSW